MVEVQLYNICYVPNKNVIFLYIYQIKL